MPRRLERPTLPRVDLRVSLKRRLRQHLASLGLHRVEGGFAAADAEKATYRAAHSAQRLDLLKRSMPFVLDNLPRFLPLVADGHGFDPSRIRLRIQKVVSGTEAARLFRMATLTWSVPVSSVP